MFRMSIVTFSVLVFFSPLALAEGQVRSSSYYGGTLLELPSSDYRESEVPNLSKESLEAREKYEEFLSRGTYSHVRSIGGGSGYSSSRGVSRSRARLSRSGSSQQRVTRSRGSFARINNRRSGRSSGFASITNTSSSRRGSLGGSGSFASIGN